MAPSEEPRAGHQCVGSRGVDPDLKVGGGGEGGDVHNIYIYIYIYMT